MADWPPFEEAFPALAGDWRKSLRQALIAKDVGTTEEICAQLGVLCGMSEGVHPDTLSSIIWLLRSKSLRESPAGTAAMHFFTVNQAELTEPHKHKVARWLRRWGEPGVAEMVFDPFAGLH